MSKVQWEYDLVDRPFPQQPQAVGWQWIDGATGAPGPGRKPRILRG